MATSGKIMLLSFLLALLFVSLEGAVTVLNPAKLPVDVLVDGKLVKVNTEMVNVEVMEKKEEIMQFKIPKGELVDAKTVKDGDVLVVVPDPTVIGKFFVMFNEKTKP